MLADPKKNREEEVNAGIHGRQDWQDQFSAMGATPKKCGAERLGTRIASKSLQDDGSEAMVDMKELARLVGELNDQLAVCMRCGMCQAVCPLYAETGLESDVARGKLALLAGLSELMFTEPKGVQDRLMRCLLCGSCAANCPSGVKVVDVFLKARAILTGYMGLGPVKKVLFRGLLAHPRFFDRLLESSVVVQSLFLQPADDLQGAYCARFSRPLMERHVKRLAQLPFHRTVNALNTATGGSGIKVGVFVGCLIDKVFPDVAKAVVRSLEHHGVGIALPDGQGCCGMPAIAAGDRRTFNELVRYNLKKFAVQHFDYLVTGCASCTATIKKVWPMMAQGLTRDEEVLLHAIAEKTIDISQFLADELKATEKVPARTGENHVLTYHDPCHLKKSLGISAQPRRIIGLNPAYRFVEMAEADRCCGCGGSFNLEHYGISASIGRRKRDHIVQSGCTTVATSCPACMLQISDMLSRSGDRVEVKHVIEVYAESLNRR